jgi:hypothetical protein
MKRSLVLAAVALVIAGCSTGPGGGYKQPAGGVLGAAAGGLAGAQIGAGTGNLAATAAGALIGAVVGSDIGGSLDRADAVYARSYPRAYYQSTPPAFYAATPAPAYQAAPNYAVPAYGAPYASAGTVTPNRFSGLPSGCQAVGSGIWCEQANGTFHSR